MAKPSSLNRAFALLTALSLSLPNPAFALRPKEPREDSKRESGLEEAMSPAAGAEEKLEPVVRDLLLELEKQPGLHSQLEFLGQNLPKLDSPQRLAFLRALPFLSDQRKVSVWTPVIFAGNSVPQVYNLLLDTLLEKGSFSDLAAMTVLLRGLPWKDSQTAGMKILSVLRDSQKHDPRWSENSKSLAILAGLAGYYSSIRNFLEQLQSPNPEDPKRHANPLPRVELYTRLNEAHDKLVASFSRLNPPRSVFAGSIEMIERGFSALYESIIITDRGPTPSEKKIIETNAPQAYQVVGSLLRQWLADWSDDPSVRLMEFDARIELEQAYGDYLKLIGDSSHISHHQSSQRLRKERMYFIAKHRRKLGLVTAAGAEERTLSARMDRLAKMIQDFRRTDPSEPWSGSASLLRSLDELDEFVKGFRERFGDNNLESYFRYLAGHDFVRTIRTSAELPPQSAPAYLAYADLLDNLRKAVSRISGFPADRMIFLSPDDHAGWLSVSGRDVVIPQENTATGDWRLTVDAPAGMYIRTDDGQGRMVSLIALQAEQRPLWEILYSAHHEAAHDAQMDRPGRLSDAPRFLELRRSVGEGGQRRREMATLRGFLENPEPVSPEQLYQLLQGTAWNLMLSASRRPNDLDPNAVGMLVGFFGSNAPRPVPAEVLQTVLQEPVLAALFPTQYVHETSFEQALRANPEIGPGPVEALDLRDDPGPLRAALGDERYEALAEFIYRWGMAFVDEIHADQRSPMNGLRFRIAQEVILNPAHPYRTEYAGRLMGPAIEEMEAVGARAVEERGSFRPQALTDTVALVAEFVRTDMPVEAFRGRLRQIFPASQPAAGAEEATSEKVKEAVERFRAERDPAKEIPGVGYYLEGKGTAFAPVLALLEVRKQLDIFSFAGVVETRRDYNRLTAVLESDPEARELLGKRILIAEEQPGETLEKQYAVARRKASVVLGTVLRKVTSLEPDLLAQLTRILADFGYRLPEDFSVQEAAGTLLEAV